jgi:hypothetical protein
MKRCSVSLVDTEKVLCFVASFNCFWMPFLVASLGLVIPMDMCSSVYDDVLSFIDVNPIL